MGHVRFGKVRRKSKTQVGNKDKIFSMFLVVILLLLIGLNFINIGGLAPKTNTRCSEEYNGLETEYLRVNTAIDNNYVTTNIYEKFYNPNNESMDTSVRFEIPSKAFISNFSLTIDNETHYAQIVPKAVGKQQYDDAVSKGMTAGLIESMDKHIFTCSVSIKSKQVIIVGLRYEQFLEKTLGGYEYRIPFSNSYFEYSINELLINISIESQFSITTLDVKDHYSNATKSNIPAKNAKVTYQESDTKPDSDFSMIYELASPPVNGTMLSYHDGVDEFFFHIFSPQKSDLDDRIMPKDIIFVLDKSGSMYGNKIEQLKTAFKEIIKQLDVNDTFNIIVFDGYITEYNTELIGASPKNRTNAVNYIDKISAGGSTNINDAMITGLKMFKAIESTRMPILVMLTDGCPTRGVMDTTEIRKNVLKENSIEVSIFCLGFGFDVDFEFLKAMSLENNGFAIRIYEDKDASLQITNFYDKISTPLLRSLNFSYSTGAYEIYPTYVEQLFEGSEIVIVGKYNGTSRNITAIVNASSSQGRKIFKETFYLDELLRISFDSKLDGYGNHKSSSNNVSVSPDSNLYECRMTHKEIVKFRGPSNKTFIPRFWGYAKIMHLLDEIIVHGENESNVENITQLAVKYGFVTPYTSLLVEVNDPGPGNDGGSSGGEGEAEAEAESESESEAEGEAEGESEGESEDVVLFDPIEANTYTDGPESLTEEVVVKDSDLQKKPKPDKETNPSEPKYVWAKINIKNDNAFTTRIFWLGIHFDWQTENSYYICSELSKNTPKNLAAGENDYFYVYMKIPANVENNSLHSYDILFQYESDDLLVDCWTEYFWYSEGNTGISFVEHYYPNDPYDSEEVEKVIDEPETDENDNSDTTEIQVPAPIIPESEDETNEEEKQNERPQTDTVVSLNDADLKTSIETEPEIEIDITSEDVDLIAPEPGVPDNINDREETKDDNSGSFITMDYAIISLIISITVIISIIIMVARKKTKKRIKSLK